MKYLFMFSFLFLSSFHFVYAKSEKEAYIESAAQFQRWCKKLTYRYFKQKKQQPYNWSSSTIRKLNDYQTTGSWKVRTAERKVYCQIRIGKKAKQAKFKIF